MDKCREAFERFECEKYEANYDDMKKNWDWYESQFGYRYSPDSLRGKDWAVWQKAWQHQQAKEEEANAKAQMCRDEKNHAINRWSVVCKERDELQKRINKALEIADELMQNAENYRVGELLEKVLKGYLDEVSKS